MQKYSMTELFKKYNLTYSRGGSIENKINKLKKVGIIIKEVPSQYARKKMYEIVNDSIFCQEWKKHPTKPYEVTKDGQVRNAENKNIYNPSLTDQGYLILHGGVTVHRLVLETFCPCELKGYFTVDHINGIRTDNRIENLRWLSQSINSKNAHKNQKAIYKKVQQLIETKGYDYVLSILTNELNK